MENTEGYSNVQTPSPTELIGFEGYLLISLLVGFFLCLTILAIRDLKRLGSDAFDEDRCSEDPYVFVPMWY